MCQVLGRGANGLLGLDFFVVRGGLVGAKTRGGRRFLGEIGEDKWLLFLGNNCMIKFHLGVIWGI